MRRCLAALSALVAPFAAHAQPVNAPPSFFPADHIAIGQKSNIQVWNPYPPNTLTTTFNVIGTGRTNGLTAELEDYPLAVQLVFYNSTASPWTLAEATISPSSQYGAASSTANTVQGVTPYDINGNAINTMLPATFNNGGQNSLPWGQTLGRYTGTSATSGLQVIPLVLSQSAASSTLTFTSTTSSAVYGSYRPGVGMYVADGKGCIKPNTTVSTSGTTTIGLSQAVASTCASGQTVWFSYQPIAAVSQVIPPTQNGTDGILVYSDWISVPALPRIDGGMVAGMSVSCTGCGSGLTVASVAPQSVTLSGNIASDVAAWTPVTFSMSPTLSGDQVANQTWLLVSSIAGLQPGQAVSGCANIPANTTVSYVNGNFVYLTGALTGTCAGGSGVTFSNTAYTTADTPSGNSLPFVSTNNKPLLLVRSMAAAGTPVGHNISLPGFAAYETGLGMPNVLASQSTTTIDGMNFVSTFGNTTAAGGNGSIILPYAIRYLTRNRGSVICPIGDSIMAGGGTPFASTSLAKIIASLIPSTLTNPVSTVFSGFGGTAPNVFTPGAAHWLYNGSCTIVLIQHPTRNSSNIPDIETNALQMANLAAASGARPVFMGGMPRGSTEVYNWVVDKPVNNSTTVYLRNTVIPTVLKNGGDSGIAITSPNMPAGTTFSFTGQAVNSITLSQAATLPAGEVMTFGYFPGSTTTNTSTSVTLGTKAAATASNYFAQDTAGCIPPSTTISYTQDSTSATLSNAATCTASGTDTITLTNNQLGDEPLIAQVSGDILSAANQETPVWNAYFCGMDPASPTNFLPGATFDATHQSYNAAVVALNGNPNAVGGQCPGALSIFRRLTQ